MAAESDRHGHGDRRAAFDLLTMQIRGAHLRRHVVEGSGSPAIGEGAAAPEGAPGTGATLADPPHYPGEQTRHSTGTAECDRRCGRSFRLRRRLTYVLALPVPRPCLLDPPEKLRPPTSRTFRPLANAMTSLVKLPEVMTKLPVAPLAAMTP